MEKFSEDFQDLDIQKAMQLAKSDTAKQLYTMLQSDSGDKLQAAADLAAAGNLNQAKQILRQLLSSEQAQQLLRRLQEHTNG